MRARSRQPGQWDKYLLGSVLFLSLLIGGGTASGLYTETLIEIAAILSAAAILSRPSGQTIPRAILWLIALGLAVFCFQIVPLPGALLDGLRPEVLLVRPWLDGETQSRFVSVGVGRTIECMLYFAAAAAFFLGVTRLRTEEVYGLVPFFFMGVICNGLAAAIQYSLSDTVAIEGLLPFTINAGLFANQNHFSALLFVSIPFVVYYGLFRGHFLSGSLGLTMLLLLLLAAGSRAGILIGLVITAISVVFLSARSRAGGYGILAVFIGLSVYTIGAWAKIDAKVVDPAFGRAEFARTTIDGMKENWVTGVGFGSFPKVYQIYEKAGMIFRTYVNHAHNDYLELALEGGIPVVLLMIVYAILLFASSVRIRREPLQKAAFLSVSFLLVHSLVDYPLRTAALAMTFAYLNAIVFHKGFAERLNQRREMGEIGHHDEDDLLVPARTSGPARQGRLAGAGDTRSAPSSGTRLTSHGMKPKHGRLVSGEGT
ncbi:O-antigen ligase family protein [Mesorhizobium sp. B2-2-4]|uniref:O-antigen ligase family protein n=1 Tax=unclassified Mesorhizobium TaxID=325217 RepID=UPI00112B4565|nr:MULTISPECIES: O-antigen ligase family protein [unclassified Mesorhizobium]MCA0023539.1 O-antigen ligase family protein [Mesorhizobium sp. B263B1A]TPJ96319.1 O-antigen ligase family protein [Mesorhizobium sp. B2-5-12]TPK29477.1 O-antigen ligase family protein [Mesorhizobium sp. B2-5-6]TPL61663.1 O-antigen ligase family protein [Mesorhizobium sp. B2-4-2]TPM61136.1 O-antigen ligase family protein [Mesorhizobium sp. B2-2-4]